MNTFLVGCGVLVWLVILAGAWLCWQLLRQNGRLLLRVEELETRLDELEFGEGEKPAGLPVGSAAPGFDSPGLLSPALSSSGGEGEHERNHRFKERSLAKSKIKRDGLKTGTPAPDFRLPRLDGRGELALSDLRGRKVLLVFSSPG